MNHNNVIQRNEVTKNLGSIKWMFPRSFASLWMTLLFLCFPISIRSQQPFRVMFWNVENLFDIRNDLLKNDEEFLPEATRRWTFFRYRDKLKKVAKTIVASGNEEQVPDLVGLCEVESDSCLYDLVKRSPLREAGYRYVMTDSPDRRGIDVALLYQRSSFRYLQHQSIRIPHEQVKRDPTRDILHVSGRILSGDTLDVVVCHMPSRSGGKSRTEPFRLLTAGIVRRTVDSLMQVRLHPHLIIMGDFNDYPSDKALHKVLCGRGDLRNLMEDMEEGTYRYRGEWGIFDQFLISENMLAKKENVKAKNKNVKAKIKYAGAYLKNVQILRHPFLLKEDDRYGGDKPFRTYNGLKYEGGYSDHLPIALDLLIRDDKDYCSE